MDVIVESIQSNSSNAFFFLFPLAGSFFYFRLRTKFENQLAKNLFYSVLSIIGLMAFVISIYGALYSFAFSFGLFQDIPASQIVAFGLTLMFLSVVYAGLERQFLQSRPSETPAIEKPHTELISSIGDATKAARNEILMFCGTMSFISRDYEQFSHLKTGRCRVRALCKRPNSVVVQEHYKLARSLGIELRYYPDDNLDPGIRARIIDPQDFENVTAILISKRLDDQTNRFKYFATFLPGHKHRLEMTLLNSLFRTLWIVADEK
jgi:hypothetical protein